MGIPLVFSFTSFFSYLHLVYTLQSTIFSYSNHLPLNLSHIPRPPFDSITYICIPPSLTIPVTPIHHYLFIILPVFPSSLTPQPCSLHTTLIHFHLHSLILIRSVTYPLYIWQIIYYFIKFHFFFFFISSPTLSSHQSFCPLHICFFLHVHNIFF